MLCLPHVPVPACCFAGLISRDKPRFRKLERAQLKAKNSTAKPVNNGQMHSTVTSVFWAACFCEASVCYYTHVLSLLLYYTVKWVVCWRFGNLTRHAVKTTAGKPFNIGQNAVHSTSFERFVFVSLCYYTIRCVICWRFRHWPGQPLYLQA
jgi:hypothetical protein